MDMEGTSRNCMTTWLQQDSRDLLLLPQPHDWTSGGSQPELGQSDFFLQNLDLEPRESSKVWLSYKQEECETSETLVVAVSSA